VEAPKEKVALVGEYDQFLEAEVSKEDADKLDSQTDPAQLIDGHLFMGSKIAAKNRDLLLARNIKYVLNMTDEIPNYYPDDFQYLKLNFQDKMDEKLETCFEECFAFIEKARIEHCGVLVHCQAGISRSASICLAYMIQVKGASLRNAWLNMKEKRPQAGPNKGYWQQLIDFEVAVTGKCTYDMTTYLVGSLVDMGFDEEKGRAALLATNNHFQDAVMHLLSEQ